MVPATGSLGNSGANRYSLRRDLLALTDPNPYRSPEHDDAAWRVTSPAVRTHRYGRVVFVVVIVLLSYSAFQLLSGMASLVTARPTYMDGLGFSNEWNEFQDAMYRNAVFRGITKLVFGTLLALFAYLPWRYSRRLRQDRTAAAMPVAWYWSLECWHSWGSPHPAWELAVR